MSSFYDDASLVVIPSGYKTSKIYAEKPTDGSGDLTFTRASGATRVASNGLIEKVRTNLALYSEDQTNWTDQNQTSVTANAAANPLNGAVTADKVIPSTATDDHYRGLSMGSIIGEFTSSIYVKADGYSIIDYGVFNSTASNYPVRAVFDLSTQTITQINGSISSITSVGSGWYRISVTASVASTSTMGIYHRVRSTGTSGNYAGDGTSGMLLWGCQLESGVITPYIGPTTTAAVSVGPVSNIPRLDYLGSSCPRLLLEPQRTNIVRQSETFDGVTWTKYNGSTVTANTVISPDGTQNADTLTVSTTVYSGLYQLISGAAGNYVVSIFAKKGTKNWLYMFDHSAAGQAWFNLDTGTIGSVNTGYTATITPYGNGWFRCTMYRNSGGTPGYFQIGLSDANEVSTPTSTGTAHIWGAQCEAGNYATSYVPTTSASVTRVADAASKTGISSLLSASEYTLFWEGTHIPTGQFNSFMTIYNAANNAFSARFYRNNTNNEVRATMFNPSTSFSLDMGSGITASYIKCALRVKAGNYAFYVNGSLVNSSTNALAPSNILDSVNLQFYGSSQSFDQNTAQALFFKTGLTNAQLAELTTL
jgi:hypothetical protein